MTIYNDNNAQERTTKRDDDARHRRNAWERCAKTIYDDVAQWRRGTTYVRWLRTTTYNDTRQCTTTT